MSKYFTSFKNPFISGILIGAIGGGIGTLIYHQIKETKFWSKLDPVSNFTLKLVNLSYQLPLYVVVIILASIFLLIFLYSKKKSKR